jgi:hypothetical protein
VLNLLLPQGPGHEMVQFCMASMLATLVLDDEAMETIRERDESAILFEACLSLLSATLERLRLMLRVMHEEEDGGESRLSAEISQEEIMQVSSVGN